MVGSGGRRSDQGGYDAAGLAGYMSKSTPACRCHSRLDARNKTKTCGLADGLIRGDVGVGACHGEP